MKKQFIKDSVGSSFAQGFGMIKWGFLVWLIGYALGIIFFTMVPANLIGWFVTPIGIAVSLWVLFKRVKGNSFKYYFFLAIIWTVIAIVCDYLFLVKAFNTINTYYRFDVFLYYALTFVLPLIVGWYKLKKNSASAAGPQEPQVLI
jgi:hypothetical protein